jgi:hypothetical protein
VHPRIRSLTQYHPGTPAGRALQQPVAKAHDRKRRANAVATTG